MKQRVCHASGRSSRRGGDQGIIQALSDCLVRESTEWRTIVVDRWDSQTGPMCVIVGAIGAIGSVAQKGDIAAVDALLSLKSCDLCDPSKESSSIVGFIL